MARKTHLVLVSSVVLLALCLNPWAWGWGNDGHEIVARIAAMNLTPKARRAAARLLGVSSRPAAVAEGMAKAATWPDTYLRMHAPKSKPWHFIDICRGTAPAASLDQFCPAGDCITTKIEQYRSNIPKGKFDEFGGKGDLSLLIHFVGDIHQPLHTTTNADRGGNCVNVRQVHSQNLHSAWDTDLVKQVEDGASVEETANTINEQFQDEPDSFSWDTGHASDIARESSALAEKEIYLALKIPRQACVVELKSCDDAPAAVRKLDVGLDSSYVEGATDVSRLQLFKAGMRLANLLNSMWP